MSEISPIVGIGNSIAWLAMFSVSVAALVLVLELLALFRRPSVLRLQPNEPLAHVEPEWEDIAA